MFSNLTTPIFLRMLKNARGWIDKAITHAEAKKFDPNLLMHARLSPDMFAFPRQIQSATDQAKGCTARLAGMEVPKFEDNEQTLTDLQARLDKTLSFVESVDVKKLDGDPQRKIVLPTRELAADDYVRFYVLPNFYFHLTTAYDILRHNGVDVGKADFLGLNR